MLANEPGDGDLLVRFARDHDEEAFAALVHRHGPMVLGICLRILPEPHDAEDAFQATFLVLAQKARSIGRPELLGSWLHAVAYRTAQHARAKTARRCRHEAEAASMSAAGCEPDQGEELRILLDRELQGLPAKYRAPLVLCYLEGRTHEDAAHQLGWPTGSMSARLARGRELLRERLLARDALCSAGVLLALLGSGAAAVPARLYAVTVQLALAIVTGKVAVAAISPAVCALMESTTSTLMPGRRRVAAILAAVLLLLALGAVAAASTLSHGSLAGARPAPSSQPAGAMPHSGCCSRPE